MYTLPAALLRAFADSVPADEADRNQAQSADHTFFGERGGNRDLQRRHLVRQHVTNGCTVYDHPVGGGRGALHCQIHRSAEGDGQSHVPATGIVKYKNKYLIRVREE